MALAEARAAWQRTANRCLVQEDAKRAPKLACCSSVPPCVKQNDTELASDAGGQEIPNRGSLPFNQNTSCSNLSPNSRWWLQLQPTYGYQKGLMDDHVNSQGAEMETCQMCDGSNILARTEDNFGMIDQSTRIKNSLNNSRVFATCENKDLTVKDEELRAVCSKNYQDPLIHEIKEVAREVRDEGLVGSKVFKNDSEQYFHSVSSWNGTEKNTPWWRTADTEELALLVSQRSQDLIQNCDLPSPQNSCVKMNLDIYTYGFNHDQISASLLDTKSNAGSRHQLTAHNYTPVSLIGRSAYQKKPRMSTEGQLVSDADKPLWDIPTHEGMSQMHIRENGTRNAQLLEALRHSQTRAREAEKAAKQALEEKQHVLKLILAQASQLFAYRQWLQLLQLENMYFQFKSNKGLSGSTLFPVPLPWLPQRIGKTRKSQKKSATRKRTRRSCLPRYDVGKYAVVFALGLGLMGAGLFLGWTIGWLAGCYQPGELCK